MLSFGALCSSEVLSHKKVRREFSRGPLIARMHPLSLVGGILGRIAQWATCALTWGRDGRPLALSGDRFGNV